MARHIASHRVTSASRDGERHTSHSVTPPYKGVTRCYALSPADSLKGSSGSGMVAERSNKSSGVELTACRLYPGCRPEVAPANFKPAFWPRACGAKTVLPVRDHHVLNVRKPLRCRHF
jgi:hypothetical protein